MARVKLTQVRSTIRRPQNQKDTMRALGLNKINQEVEKEVNPTIEGMINVVKHLIRVEEVN
ncbi:MAG: 50S ribosomal protein L30 [Flavobacteriales bacterium]